MDSVIYFFSATGNSLKVAKDIGKEIENTTLIKICKDTVLKEGYKNYKKVGIVFPVYYYGLPLMVKEFVKGLKLDEDTYIYAIATCGGSVGNALSQLNEILKNKGLSLSSAFSIVMPDNYQIMYSPPSLNKQLKLFKDEEAKIKSISYTILKDVKLPSVDKNNLLLKIGYQMLSGVFKPREKDKNFWTDDKCNGCGICSKVCPANNIIYENSKPKWCSSCEQCLACMHWCPNKAIQYKKGTIKRDRYHHPEIKISELFNKIN
jgi:ferredoxin/flavodoxin